MRTDRNNNSYQEALYEKQGFLFCAKVVIIKSKACRQAMGV